jgi:hypothetical protein
MFSQNLKILAQYHIKKKNPKMNSAVKSNIQILSLKNQNVFSKLEKFFAQYHIKKKSQDEWRSKIQIYKFSRSKIRMFSQNLKNSCSISY